MALTEAENGLRLGECPIGAVVVLGDEVVARAHTQEKRQARRLVHAELLALEAADERLGWRRRDKPVYLATTLEPCLMCLGAAMVFGVDEIHYALESPADGGGQVARDWTPHPSMPWFRAPVLVAGAGREAMRELLARYIEAVPPGPLSRWTAELLDLTKILPAAPAD